jgi:2,3-bisphosphoglycerate-independent phosphoglycerate mutase
MKAKQKTALLILDGWGSGRKDKSDAVYLANTPFMDSLEASGKGATLLTFGEHVGLPEGQMGNSEVGHMNLGAGRVVYQDLVRIDLAIREGSFFKEPSLVGAIDYCLREDRYLHLMGLVSSGGVHSSIEHLKALLRMCAEKGLKKVVVHAFTDGRDTDPRAGLKYLEDLEELMNTTGGRIATIIGRYYAMDRDKRWDRIKKAYDMLVRGEGEQFPSATDAMRASYSRGISDEFIEPCVIGSDAVQIREGDAVICFNFRTDRCREITEALTQRDFPEQGMRPLSLHYVTMTRYDATYQNVKVVYHKQDLSQTLGEVIADQGLSQVRIAETEKYPHVTFFFSGGREEVFSGEKRIMVSSPKVPTYDLQPEMSAAEVTDRAIEIVLQDEPDFICLNYANPDMVGHTGVIPAIVKACETVDACTERLSKVLLEKGYAVLITADHGNADMALNEDGSPNTAHTLNLVPLYLLGVPEKAIHSGILADIAPTVLDLMGIPTPELMQGNSLLRQNT